MVRGVGRTVPGRPVLGEIQQNGDPPQSTLAAQLVNHFTDGRKRSKTQDQEAFRQLLREILSTESELGSQNQAQETDCALNYKLIYVIVKAGLDSLDHVTSFNEQGERCKQVINSLSAVGSTLKRCPEILFMDAPSEESGSSPHGPLFSWLISKLLLVIGQQEEDNILKGTSKLLETILLLDRKTHFKGTKKSPILNHLKGCVNGQCLCQ